MLNDSALVRSLLSASLSLAELFGREAEGDSLLTHLWYSLLSDT